MHKAATQHINHTANVKFSVSRFRDIVMFLFHRPRALPRDKPRRSTLTTLLSVLTLAACSATSEHDDALEPKQNEHQRLATNFMVSTAHPLASDVGAEVLRQGGNAMDAAVAVQMTLGFVEAPETGIGGGGFLLYRDGDTGNLHFYDGRETAPAATRSDRFTLLGHPAPLWAAVPSGRAVGVPGLVAMLDTAHQAHGSQPWPELLEPAISLADEGIEMPKRLQQQVRDDFSLRLFGDMRDYFRTQAAQEPPQLRNPALAMTLRKLAEEGTDSFYQGEIAQGIVDRAGNRNPWASDMTLADLAEYRAKERTPVCGPYRQWTICGAPPPSSGGITLLQILGVLEHFPMPSLAPDSIDAIHYIAEASRLAYADRFQYLGDPAFSVIPVEDMIAPDYLARRAQLINVREAMTESLPGIPGVSPLLPEAEPPDEEETTGTSHFTIVDARGNVVALTSSIEAPFGARMMTHGFLLNNQLTDFTFNPDLDGLKHPNAPAAGKRPRSSMAPTMVFDADGELKLVIGSRGGARIIGHVAKALIGVLDWEMDIQDAIALPNVVHRGQTLELERGTPLTRHREALRAMGHEVDIATMTSGLHGVERTDERWRGGADPRLDGIVVGD